jgi:DNA topoisomerase-1
MTPETVTFEDALKLLSLPRTLGEADGEEVVAANGRYGPYVTDGETNASLRRGDDPEGLTMDRALELLAERRAKGPAPKKPRRPAGKR